MAIIVFKKHLFIDVKKRVHNYKLQCKRKKKANSNSKVQLGINFLKGLRRKEKFSWTSLLRVLIVVKGFSS